VADLFWHHCISQPKALRNRLKIVEWCIEEEITRVKEKRGNANEPITLVSVGGGSARAIIHSLNRLAKKGFDYDLKVINIDVDARAIKLGKEIAERFGVQDSFEWINDDARNLQERVQEKSIDIIEMVGLLDYFSLEDASALIHQIYTVLKQGGVFIVANVFPNEEMPFVSHLGWPKMYYRRFSDIERILKMGGFEKEAEIFLEPLRVHAIAKVIK